MENLLSIPADCSSAEGYSLHFLFCSIFSLDCSLLLPVQAVGSWYYYSIRYLLPYGFYISMDLIHRHFTGRIVLYLGGLMRCRVDISFHATAVCLTCHFLPALLPFTGGGCGVALPILPCCGRFFATTPHFCHFLL